MLYKTEDIIDDIASQSGLNDAEIAQLRSKIDDNDIPEFSFGDNYQIAELSGHVIIKVFSGFAASKTIRKLFVKPSKFICKIFNIALCKIKFWYRTTVFIASNLWHSWPASFFKGLRQSMAGRYLKSMNKFISHVVVIITKEQFLTAWRGMKNWLQGLRLNNKHMSIKNLA